MGWHEHEVQTADSPQQSGPDKIAERPAIDDEPQQRRAEKCVPPSCWGQALCGRMPTGYSACGPLMFKQKYREKGQAEQQELGDLRVAQLLDSHENAVELWQDVVLHDTRLHELIDAQPDCRVDHDLGHDEKR